MQLYYAQRGLSKWEFYDGDTIIYTMEYHNVEKITYKDNSAISICFYTDFQCQRIAEIINPEKHDNLSLVRTRLVKDTDGNCIEFKECYTNVKIISLTETEYRYNIGHIELLVETA